MVVVDRGGQRRRVQVQVTAHGILYRVGSSLEGSMIWDEVEHREQSHGMEGKQRR